MDRLDASQIVVPGLEVRVLERCTSTNALLLESGEAHPVLLAAEEQTAGRGRRGRRWHSEPGAGLTFSIRRRIRCSPSALGGLSLAVGIAAARVLRSLGAAEVAIKWPNDLLLGGAKLGGILIQSRPEGAGTAVVAGIGLNCRPVAGLARRLRRPVAFLEQHLPAPVSRNALLAALAREVLGALGAFEREGLAAFADAWPQLNAHEGRRLRVRLADGRTLSGIAEGIAPDGALRLRTRAGLRALHAARIVS